MEFAAPSYGLLMVPIVLLLLLNLWNEHRKEEQRRRFADPRLLRQFMKTETPWGKIARLLLPTVVMLLLTAALMRPQWGTGTTEPATGLDLIFAVDLSRSMLADDLSPSRLAVAKRAVAETLAERPGDRVGLIGFAGSAFLLCPLTEDRDMALRILHDLDTEMLPKGGSSIPAALREAARAFQGTAAKGSLLVLVSDGENHGGNIEQAAAELKKMRVVVCAALVGTSSGGLMLLPDGDFVKDRDGRVVKSRADLATLRRIDLTATALSGDGSGLTAQIAAAAKTLRGSEAKSVSRHRAERYYLPLAAALLIWCLGKAFSLRRADR